jgi:pyruvate kinase
MAVQTAKKEFCLRPGDHMVVTGGMTNGVSGNTNMIKVETIQ